MSPAAPSISFAYWSDPLCVWAYVAQRKLDALLAAHPDTLEVRYHVVPVFGSIPWRFTEGSWAKAGPAGRQEVTARVAREHGAPGITGEVWLKDPPASSWAPGLAIKAVFEIGRASCRERVS